MKERIITLETAQLAQSKGMTIFDCPTGILGEEYAFHYGNRICSGTKTYFELDYVKKRILFPAPTQSLLQKWLREVHNIHILMSLAVPTLQHRSVIYQVKEGKVITVMDFTATDNENYEEVLEVGLQEALKLIQ